MGPLEELLAVSERRALEFFATGLKDVCEPGVDRQELVYNASVLAHYALVSTESTSGWPAPRTLAAVFDQFVQDPHTFSSSSMMEEAAAQCLVIAGFIETPMHERQNCRWYDDLGDAVYARAAAASASPRRARFFEVLAREFEPWRRRHARLSRELRDIPYLLHVPDQPPTM
jgi:hypothetical protein